MKIKTKSVRSKKLDGRRKVIYPLFSILILLLTYHFLLITVLCSAIYTYTDGTTSAQFLNIPVSARAVALGDAYTGYAADSGVIEYNPAGLGNLYTNDIRLSNLFYFEDTAIQSLTLVLPKKKFVLGFSGKYLNVKDTERDISGNDKNDFYITNWSVLFGAAYKITPDFFVGLSARNISEKLKDKKASGAALNTGIYLTLPKQKIDLGVSVVNIGQGLKFIDERDPLSLTLKLGGSWGITHKTTLLVEVIQQKDISSLRQRLGLEYHLTEPLWLRLGWKIDQRKFDNYTGFTSGFGLRYNKFYLDYAFVPHYDLGVSHYVTMGLRFGKSLPLPKQKIEEESETQEEPPPSPEKQQEETTEQEDEE
ncbi:MAG TPA: hypothetical protein DCX95_01305 [Elusimicrobia bacterium]|nr:hypothetical protein [Elusimicrobiota bacterium]